MGEYETGKEKNHSILTTKNWTTPLADRYYHPENVTLK